MLELKRILFNGGLFRKEVFAKPFLGNLVWFLQDKPAIKFCSIDYILINIRLIGVSNISLHLLELV
ncbi:unnamed protein product, partial [Vitis vinifera]